MTITEEKVQVTREELLAAADTMNRVLDVISLARKRMERRCDFDYAGALALAAHQLNMTADDLLEAARGRKGGAE